jgi:hypothetical protein
MKILIAAIGFLLAAGALADGGNLVVQLSPTQQLVMRGSTPHFVVKITPVSSTSRIIKFEARRDLKDAYVRLIVTRNGAVVDVPVEISDPGAVDDQDYVELPPGQTMTVSYDGSPLVLSKLPPGLYSASVSLQPDWSAAPITSNSVSFRVVKHASK